MGIRLIIDSASDISPEEAKKQGMILLSQSIRFGDEEFRDAVELTHREFYQRLEQSNVLPTTSQINPGVYGAVLKKIAEEGDEAIIITMSSKLSGTHQSAVIAAQEYEDRAYVVDSENVCVGERILIQLALGLRDQGLSAREIVERLNEEKKKIRVIALLDTLEYLKKGGRISATVAFAGSLLSIKPVVAVEQGAVALVGKARGSRQGNNLLRQLIEKTGVDFEKPFALAYSGLSDELLRKYISDSEDLWMGHTRELPISTVGCTIGTHVGPGAVAVAFFEP